MRRQFKREVSLTRELTHEGLCRIFDFVEHVPSGGAHPIPCLTMQLLDGTSLEEYVTRHRPLHIDTAHTLIRQIAAALDVLHRHHIIHRDLKPSNVILLEEASGLRAVLTDFGLAKSVTDGALFESLGQMQGGAPYFLAPELFRGSRPSFASDIYALGLLVDEMVTTSRAFPADSLHGLCLQKLDDHFEPPSARTVGLPSHWDEAIRRCLHPDPTRRFSTPLELVQHLELRKPRTVSRWLAGRRPRLAVATAAAGALALAATVTERGTSRVIVTSWANQTGSVALDSTARTGAAELARRLRAHNRFDVRTLSSVSVAQPESLTLAGQIGGSAETPEIRLQLSAPGALQPVWSEAFPAGQRPSVLHAALSDAAVEALDRWQHSEQRAAPGYSLPRPLRQWTWWVRHTPASGTRSNEAFDLYMRGRILYEERTLRSAREAVSYLQGAVELDPSFALAYSTLADVQGVMMDFNGAPHAELLASAEHYATQAVSLDPALPEAQLSLAAVLQMQRRWSAAEQAYRQTIAAHPTSARAHRWYAGLLLQTNRTDESVRLAARALELDPHDFPNHSAYGLILFYSGRLRDAETQLEALLARKDLPYGHAVLGQVYAVLVGTAEGLQRESYVLKALQEATALRQRELTTGDVNKYADLIEALAFSYAGDVTRARPALARLEQGHGRGEISSATLARVYAVQGQAELALQSLESAETQGDRELLHLGVSPFFKALHGDSRFVALQRRLGL